jgi:Zn-dependent protease
MAPESQESSADPAGPQPRSAGGGGRSAAKIAGAGLLAVLAKLKGGLILLKGLKFGKLLLTMGSMFVMVWFEAVRYGWIFGVGFVLLILVHELGHGFAMKKAGVQGGYPVFIPFFGAMIAMKGQPRTPLVEAEIALAGPIAGTVASVACAAMWLATHGRLWLALAHVGFFLNLFNMTPLPPLDGGRVARLFSRQAWILGAVIIGAMFVATKTPQLLLIGLLALLHRPTAPDLTEVPLAARRNMAAHYFGLCVFLAAGTYLAGQMLGP